MTIQPLLNSISISLLSKVSKLIVDADAFEANQCVRNLAIIYVKESDFNDFIKDLDEEFEDFVDQSVGSFERCAVAVAQAYDKDI